MGTFSSGTGLISGFDIEGYVSQIMELEGKNRDTYATRIEDNTEEQDALKELQDLINSVQLSAANFGNTSVFEKKLSTSSDDDIMTASARTWATPGSYQFVVKSLATKHQFVTRNSYSSRDSSVGTGTISLEVGQGQLARDTDLTTLNGRTGIQRGKFQITDKSGTNAVIDLTTALSVNDVIAAINSSDADVTASVSGDGLVITDNSEGSGELIIAEYGDGQTAADLGILQSTSNSRIIGEDIVSLSEYSLLSELNDGNGIRDLDLGITIRPYNASSPEAETSDDINIKFSDNIDGSSKYLHALNSGSGIRLGIFKITDQNGISATIDVSDLDQDSITLDELVDEINNQTTAAGMDIEFKYLDSDRITVVDNSEALSTTDDGKRKSDFIIEDLEGGHTAADLGIENETSSSAIAGETIWKMETIADVIASINYDSANSVYGNKVYTASIAEDGNGLTITSADLDDFIIVDRGEGSAATDLGIATGYEPVTNSVVEGKALIAGLNTVLLSSLNGGSGGNTENEDTYGSSRITSGNIVNITDGAGNTSQIDLTDAISIQDVLDAFNNIQSDSNTTNITASLNSAGNGIVLNDSSSSGSMTVEDEAGGNIAQLLNIAGTGSDSITSGNLQLQYVSEATLITDLRNGEGITRGIFTITDSSGTSKEINLVKDDITTVGDIINAISQAGTNIKARINDNGDGIMLYDETSSETSGLPISVTDNSSGTAAALGLTARDAVKDEDGHYYIDGSFELTLDLGGSDSLQDIADMVTESGLGVTSDVIFDGTGYRLSFTSDTSGRKGTVHFDAGTTSMKVDNVTTAKDAILLLGDGTEEHPMLINSSSNTIKDAIYGTTLEINKVSDDPVTITIADDVDSMVEEVKGFVGSYNEVMSYIAEATSFDTETYEKGILFADNTVSTVKQQMVAIIQKIFNTDTGSYNSLASIGISFSALGTETGTDANGESVTYATSNGLQITFDEQVFRDAFSAESQSISSLFTTDETGIGDYITGILENLASSTVESSTLQNRIDAITDENSLISDRIDDIEEQLTSKEERMYSQFYAMEETLAQLQTQQSAISSLGTTTA